jgi:L-rhamnose mutarotase
MEKIEIELGAWESTLMPIYTANVDVELAERLLYNTMLNYYDEQEIIKYLTTEEKDYRWGKFMDRMCEEEEKIVIECGGVYYDDMTDEEYNAICGFNPNGNC